MGARALKRSRSRQTAASADETHPNRLVLIGVSEKSRVLHTVLAELPEPFSRPFGCPPDLEGPGKAARAGEFRTAVAGAT